MSQVCPRLASLLPKQTNQAKPSQATEPQTEPSAHAERALEQLLDQAMRGVRSSWRHLETKACSAAGLDAPPAGDSVAVFDRDGRVLVIANLGPSMGGRFARRRRFRKAHYCSLLDDQSTNFVTNIFLARLDHANIGFLPEQPAPLGAW
jgi:hypothetical protein